MITQLVRLRAPVSVTGTLGDPTFGIKPEKLALQTGAAVALGVLLTPVASVLAFIDPGLAKDTDCAAVLTQEQATTSGAPSSEPYGLPLDYVFSSSA